MQLTDIMHQVIQLPLGIDLTSASQGKPISSMIAVIAKDRLHGAQSFGIDSPACRAVYAGFHAFQWTVRFLWAFIESDGYLFGPGLVRIRQALAA